MLEYFANIKSVDYDYLILVIESFFEKEGWAKSDNFLPDKSGIMTTFSGQAL